MSPFLVLLIGVAFVVVAIAAFKVHPFFALLIAAVLVGVLPARRSGVERFLEECCQADNRSRVDLDILYPGYRRWSGSGEVSLEEFRAELRAAGRALVEEGTAACLEGHKWRGIPSRGTAAIDEVTSAFGRLFGNIGLVIAMAAVIGQCLMESGAADKITRRLLALLGEKRASLALLGSGYILSVPVFFDTVFFLLVPLARALRMRTGRNFLAYVMAICAGGAVTHSLVPPTPGPLVMVDNLGLDLGVAIYGGFLLGLPVAAFGGLLFPAYLGRRLDIPLRDTAGSTREDLQAIVDTPEEKLPGFLVSILPVALPVVLITAHSVVGALMRDADEPYWALYTWTSLAGEKNLALFLGMAIGLWVLARQKRYSLDRTMQAIEPALAAAGVIILITCAGGAFGAMLKATGIGESIQGMVGGGGMSPAWFIALAWIIAAVMKIAQGSGTVAIITASSIMGSILQGGTELPFHTIYIFAAVAFGSKFISWMNDSGFWVVCKMSGFTQAETLKSWTVLLGLMGVAGFFEVVVLSFLLPLK